MAKCHRKQSKRMTCRKKYKIKRKVAEHHRKVRKEMKKNPSSHKPKDPGVPNSLPFKEEILREAELRKQRAKDLKDAQKASRLKLQMENRGLDEMVVDAIRDDEQFEKKTPATPKEPEKKLNSENFKSYFKELKKVVEAADVILEVLDSRDPLGSRCPELEELVISAGKKLVLVLNKIDLIPRNNLEEWLKYLRQSLPTVAFKASTQSQNSNLGRSKTAAIHISESLQSSSCCIGASFLMKVLGNYCRNQNIQTFIKVGVVGFPNVGKSSVINSLKRSRTCSVGSTPGLTKTIQEVSLDKHIKIIDSPGVVLAKGNDTAILALKNAVKIERLIDVITPAEVIIQRADQTQLCLHYTIPSFSSTNELLSILAKRSGKFKKGGIPDVEAGARRLINDWNRGVIKYYTHPPEIYTPDVYLNANIVSEFSKAFDISALEEKMELDKATELFPGKCVVAKSSGPTAGRLSDGEEEMEAETAISNTVEEKKVTVEFVKKKVKAPPREEFQVKLAEQQLNKAMKKKFKRMQKNRKKQDRAALALSDTMDDDLTL